MDKKDEKAENESTGCCGCCGGRRCCAGKAALVLVLLLIGGLIGYGMGRCHSSRWGCPYSMSDRPMSGDQTPSAK